MSDNSHSMKTRSKNTDSQNKKDNPPSEDDFDELDEYGNIDGLIDYEEGNDDFDQGMFEKEIRRLSGNKSISLSPKIKKNNHRKRGTKKLNDKKLNDKKLNDVFMSYLIMKATEKANLVMKTKVKKKKRSKIKVLEETQSPDETDNLIREINLDNQTETQDDNMVITILNANFSDDESSRSSISSISSISL